MEASSSSINLPSSALPLMRSSPDSGMDQRMDRRRSSTPVSLHLQSSSSDLHGSSSKPSSEAESLQGHESVAHNIFVSIVDESPTRGLDGPFDCDLPRKTSKVRFAEDIVPSSSNVILWTETAEISHPEGCLSDNRLDVSCTYSPPTLREEGSEEISVAPDASTLSPSLTRLSDEFVASSWEGEDVLVDNHEDNEEFLEISLATDDRDMQTSLSSGELGNMDIEIPDDHIHELDHSELDVCQSITNPVIDDRYHDLVVATSHLSGSSSLLTRRLPPSLPPDIVGETDVSVPLPVFEIDGCSSQSCDVPEPLSEDLDSPNSRPPFIR